MQFHKQFEQATAASLEALTSDPSFLRFLHGDVPREAYAMFLRETYHLSRHTSRFLSAAVSRMTDEQDQLRSRYMHHALEEDGHHKFALKDLRNLGFEESFATESHPLAGTEAIISFHYYLAHIGNPVSIMGAVMVFEGLAESMAGTAAKSMREKHDLEKSAVTFLHTHAHFDIEHMKDARLVLDTLISSEKDKEEIIDVARKMYKFYQMNFENILNLVAEPELAVQA